MFTNMSLRVCVSVCVCKEVGVVKEWFVVEYSRMAFRNKCLSDSQQNKNIISSTVVVHAVRL